MVAVRAEPAGSGWVCDVRVEFAGESTQHTVTVSAAEVARWSTGAQRKDVEELVVRSFEFLLEREPPSSILRRFELSAIQRYFPEYDREFRLGRGGKP